MLVGVGAGLLAGLFGVGGGIMFVPALVFFAGLSQLEAEATSLLAIVPVAAVGAWRQHTLRQPAAAPRAARRRAGDRRRPRGRGDRQRGARAGARDGFAALLVFTAYQLIREDDEEEDDDDGDDDG